MLVVAVCYRAIRRGHGADSLARSAHGEIPRGASETMDADGTEWSRSSRRTTCDRTHRSNWSEERYHAATSWGERNGLSNRWALLGPGPVSVQRIDSSASFVLARCPLFRHRRVTFPRPRTLRAPLLAGAVCLPVTAFGLSRRGERARVRLVSHALLMTDAYTLRAGCGRAFGLPR